MKKKRIPIIGWIKDHIRPYYGWNDQAWREISKRESLQKRIKKRAALGVKFKWRF